VGPQFFPAIPPKTAPGWKSIGNRALFATKELNSFYGALGENTGLIDPVNDKGSAWLRMVTDLALPGALGNASSPFKRATILRSQRSGTR
jgi:hypothetical protein